MGKWCLHASLFIFDWIIIKVVGNQDRHENLVEFDFGRIRQLILELLAHEWRKFHTFELKYLWSQLANLDQILCVASLGWGKGCIRFWGRLTLARWTQVSDRCPLGYLLQMYCTFLTKLWTKEWSSSGRLARVISYFHIILLLSLL